MASSGSLRYIAGFLDYYRNNADILESSSKWANSDLTLVFNWGKGHPVNLTPEQL